MKTLATLPLLTALSLAAPPALAGEALAPQWPPPAPAGDAAALPPADPGWTAGPEAGRGGRPRKVRPVQSGFWLGFRESAAIPRGDLVEGAAITSSVAFAAPFRLEAGFRFPFGLGLGAYGHAGWAVPDCSDAYATCWGAVWAFGVQADVRFNQRGRAMPWIGASIGREYLFFSVDDGIDTWDTTYRGADIGFQGGIDFRAGTHFALGPFVQYSVSTYDEVRLASGGTSATVEIPDDGRAEHAWFHVGLKGTATF